MPLLLRLLLLLLVSPLAYFFIRAEAGPNKKKRFAVFICMHALFLTGLVITVLNMPLAILTDEISFLNFFQNWDKGQHRRAYNFINDHFLLIDNAYDKQLLPKPDQTQGDSTSIAITNRQKLAALFTTLANDSNNTDLVICDIGFDDISNFDSVLSVAMMKLYKQDKLLISVAGHPSSNKQLSFPRNISGDIKEKTSERLFTTHTLKRNDLYSLPYLVYAGLNAVKRTSPFCFNTILEETDVTGNIRWKMNSFLPHFLITDEALLSSDFSEVQEPAVQTNDIDSTGTETILLRTLGNSISEIGQEDLLLNLAARKHQHKKNFILVGTFSGNEDIHKTAYTELHGPVIILNLVYALERNQNHISLLFVSICLAFFSFISWLLFGRIWKRIGEYKKSGSSDEKHHQLKSRSMFFLLLIHFFAEEIHYFILLAAVVTIYYITGIMINGISLAVYLAAFETFGIYFGKHLINRNHKILAL